MANRAWAQENTLSWYQQFFKSKPGQSPEKAVAQAQFALSKAHDAFDPRGEAVALKTLGLIHLTQTYNYDKAMDYFIKALSIEDSLHLKQEEIFTYLATAQVFEEIGDYYKSTELLAEALRLNEEKKDPEILVVILNKLGKINAAKGNIEEAFENYEQVLRYKNSVQDPGVEAEALYNTAQLYVIQGKYEKALEKHKEALHIRRSVKDRYGEAVSLNTIGELYFLMKNEGKALANYVVALEIRQDLKDHHGIAESYNNIGVLYYNQKNYQRAVANLQLALNEARDGQDHVQLRKCYEYLSLCYEASGSYRDALLYKNNFLAIDEFIQREKSAHELTDRESRYMIGKKESQIEKLEVERIQREKELAFQRSIRNFLFVLVAFGMIIIALIIYMYLMKRRSNKVLQVAHQKVQEQNVALQQLNATKDKFFSIISHDLKGPLNSLTSFSGLLINHTDSLSKEEIKMLANDLDKSLKNLFALLENLLEWSRSQTGNIEFKPEVFDLATLLEENKDLLKAQAQNKQIDIINRTKDSITIRAHRNSINTVVRNLISNAIKFTPHGGQIVIQAEHVNGSAKVSVIDNGVGMSKEIMEKLFRIESKHSTKGTADEKGTGLGLILCKEFVEKNGGAIGVHSEPSKGSEFYFTLPM
jgi:signal transduction histidine kinase